MNSDRNANPLVGLARALFDVRPLATALPAPVRISWPRALPAAEAVLQRIAHRLDLPTLVCCGPSSEDLSVLEQSVSDRIRAAYSPGSGLVTDYEIENVDLAADEAIAQVIGQSWRSRTIMAPDGMLVTAHAAGSPAAPALVLALPCGMPVGLCDQWIRTLAAEFFVLTWETRGMFGHSAIGDAPLLSASAQAADLLAVLDEFGIDRAHMMGICSGAVVAILAADEWTSRVSSLSLWHGDYKIGSDAPTTQHQRSMRAVLENAAESRARAASMHLLFCESVRAAGTSAAKTGRKADLAHWFLYPFANPELLFRFAKLKGHLLAVDLRGPLSRIGLPALVVTSVDDQTTHPEGSRRVAGALAQATLSVSLSGDHLSVFDAQPALTRLARAFISHPRSAASFIRQSAALVDPGGKGE